MKQPKKRNWFRLILFILLIIAYFEKDPLTVALSAIFYLEEVIQDAAPNIIFNLKK